ncbi:pyridoxal phosphate-dependent transferase [Fimicolochytrium jonesii]|uniref:pyridoxal phosphate-dependent transferase n=1 Tax=Fimicolochytrium jonesii TaxID=1396493 RepID=UPI0022FE3DC9|nr:pyridoxal phosphate-dependent transferase [Fimicolochytrium jonesii]KAI8825570.1 pyridoxal phosphate-dependent transferase [Fimicolochytrium jonesii]
MTAPIETEDTPLTLLTPDFKCSGVKRMQRSLDYAQHPRKYLENVLGAETFTDREHLFCLPEVGKPDVEMDVYGAGGHMKKFQGHVAEKVLGKKHGLFFGTGVAAQLSALKEHCTGKGNNLAAWHHLSHLEGHEESAFDTLWGLRRTLIGEPTKVPTVADIETLTTLPEAERPAVILLEVPNRELACRTFLFEDLVHISKLCRAAGVALHLDGARLWEIEPYYQEQSGKSIKDITALFDSVYVSLYKGLGGHAGAILASDNESFMAATKTWRRRAGVNPITSYQETIDCERGFNENIGTFAQKYAKLKSVAAAITQATSPFHAPDGSRFIVFEPSIPTCSQTVIRFHGATSQQLKDAVALVEKQHRIRIAARFAPWTESVEEKKQAIVARTKRQEEVDAGRTPVEPEDTREHYFEMHVTREQLKVEDGLYVKAYVAFCEAVMESIASEGKVSQTKA